MNALRTWIGLVAVVAVAGLGQAGCAAAVEEDQAAPQASVEQEDVGEATEALIPAEAVVVGLAEFPATHELTAPSPQAITGCCIKCYNKPALYSANQHQCYQQAVDLCDGWWNIKWAEKC